MGGQCGRGVLFDANGGVKNTFAPEGQSEYVDYILKLVCPRGDCLPSDTIEAAASHERMFEDYFCKADTISSKGKSGKSKPNQCVRTGVFTPALLERVKREEAGTYQGQFLQAWRSAGKIVHQAGGNAGMLVELSKIKELSDLWTQMMEALHSLENENCDSTFAAYAKGNVIGLDVDLERAMAKVTEKGTVIVIKNNGSDYHGSKRVKRGLAFDWVLRERPFWGAMSTEEVEVKEPWVYDNVIAPLQMLARRVGVQVKCNWKVELNS